MALPVDRRRHSRLSAASETALTEEESGAIALDSPIADGQLRPCGVEEWD
ncbi:hypothetical protein [Saccharopolyspora hattusasensis]